MSAIKISDKVEPYINVVTLKLHLLVTLKHLEPYINVHFIFFISIQRSWHFKICRPILVINVDTLKDIGQLLNSWYLPTYKVVPDC